MSQENVEVVRRAFDGAAGRSIEQAAETFWHPDITYVEDPRWPGASTYKGTRRRASLLPAVHGGARP
jgi:hypothetical protein